VQDPQIQLNDLGIALKDAIDGTRDAILDAEHRSFVNWETFFFADLESKRRFDEDPARFCGVLTDPVSRQRFVPGDRPPRSQHDGRVYFFYSEAAKATFDAAPSMYATANFDMIKM
jgi:YHS domain-containing protein